MRTLLAALLTAAAVRRLFVVVTVRGNSMRPTYTDGDVLLAARVPLLRRGRAIVFTPPANPPGAPPYRVKRLVALPGDPTPDWVKDARRFVPAGRLVVRGDAVRSEDSGTYGYVDRAGVLAVVVRRLRPHRPRCHRRCRDRGQSQPWRFAVRMASMRVCASVFVMMLDR